MEAWWRQLKDGRIEISCKGNDVSMRLSAPEADAWKFVSLFEETTGLIVAGERKPPRRRPVMKGQMGLLDG